MKILTEKVLERFTRRETSEVVKCLENLLVPQNLKSNIQIAILEQSDCNVSQVVSLIKKAESNPGEFLEHYQSWKNFKSEPKDIRVGEFEVIKWIEYDANIPSLQIDHLLQPLIQLFDALETECVRDCCGIDAFSFWPQTIKKASERLVIAERSTALDGIIEEVEILKSESVEVSFLNNHFHKEVFVHLLKHIRRNIG